MKDLVKRCEKVPFFGVPDEDGNFTFYRMKGFSAASVNRNPIEYSRQYIDEDFERCDIIGYKTALDYEFDMFKDNPVHNDISAISEGEFTDNDAVRPIVMVDLSSEKDGVCNAVIRDFSIIPSREGVGFDAYIYSGQMKANSKKQSGTVTSDDGFETVVFVAA